MIKKMIDGERISITAHTLSNLRKKKNEVLCRIDKGGKINSSKAQMTLNAYFNLQIPQTESKNRTAIEEGHIELFMDYVKNNKQYSYSYPAFVILFNLGVRVGQMAALTWDDVDFKNNAISINKMVDRYRKADYGFTMRVCLQKAKHQSETFR